MRQLTNNVMFYYMDHYSRLFLACKEKVEFSENFIATRKVRMFGRILALIVRKLPSDGIMKEENREHPERFCWWCFKKGVQDGIDKDANCWF